MADVERGIEAVEISDRVDSAQVARFFKTAPRESLLAP